MSSVSIEDVSIRRGDDDVVRSLTLTMKSGSWTSLVGPNGAGKSSLIGAIAGLLPYRGRLLIDGTDVASLSIRQRATLVAVVPQRPELPAGCSVYDYVLLGRTAHRSLFGGAGRKDKQIVSSIIERLELQWLADRDITALSGGELQRATIGRALAQQARVMLLDEPTSALDIHHQQQALELIDVLRRTDELTVCAAMHDLTLASQFGDTVALMACGELLAHGPPEVVVTQEHVLRAYGADVVVRHDEEFGLAVIPRRRVSTTESLQHVRAP
jgi:iron complex transport system ATP-binding protein